MEPIEIKSLSWDIPDISWIDSFEEFVNSIKDDDVYLYENVANNLYILGNFKHIDNKLLGDYIYCGYNGNWKGFSSTYANKNISEQNKTFSKAIYLGTHIGSIDNVSKDIIESAKDYLNFSGPKKRSWDIEPKKPEHSGTWDVYLNGEKIDTVFYHTDCDEDYVRRGLVDHDGYDPNIQVKDRYKRHRKVSSYSGFDVETGAGRPFLYNNGKLIIGDSKQTHSDLRESIGPEVYHVSMLGRVSHNKNEVAIQDIQDNQQFVDCIFELLQNNILNKEAVVWIFGGIGPPDKWQVQDIFQKDLISWDIKPIEVDPKKVNLLYAIYCAEAVLSIYEEQYPNDDRVRKCIEAAKTCFKNPSKENRDKAYSDAADTDADAYAANAATAAGYAATAAYAANATAYYAAYATAYYADNAAAFFAANAIKYARQAAKRTNKNIDFDSLLAKAQEDIWEYTQETTSSLRFSEEWDIKPILNSGYQADTIEDFISIAGPRQVWKTFDSIKAKYFYFILGNAYRYEISNFNTVFIYSIMWFYDEPKITYPISWNVKGIYNFGETDFPLIFVKDSPLINSWDIPEIDEFEVGDKVKIKSWIVFSWYCDNVGNKDFYNSDKRILEIIRTDYEKHPGWPKVWEDGEIVISIIHKDVNYTNATPKVISIPVSKAKEAIIKI